MPLPDPFRTTSFRLAVGYAVLFVVSVLVIMGTTYLVASAEVRGVVRSSIDEDMAVFARTLVDGGPEALGAVVRERSDNAPDDRFFLLVSPDGRVIAGNLAAGLWRPGWADRKLADDVVAAQANLSLAASQNSDHEVRLLSLGDTLSGFKVLSGRNSHILDETQEIILAALLWGCIATTLVALIGGYVVSLGPSRRVDQIAATTRQIVSGRLDLRLPVSRRRDELDRLAADINAMLARIEVLMSSLKQVSTDIAHDLRTPLARLRQGLETVRKRPGDPSAYESAIDGAIAETDAIIATFNALLRISQIEAGARRARFAPVDLSALCETMADVYAAVASDMGHRLETAIETGLGIDGDRDLLTQMIANLVENAINHVPPPGRIRISLRVETTDEPEDGAAGGLPAGPGGETRRIVLAVGDDGPGIPQDEREKVFRRLYRLDRSRTTPGSGLGLALVFAIAELHGARVEACDNRPGLLMRVAFGAGPGAGQGAGTGAVGAAGGGRS